MPIIVTCACGERYSFRDEMTGQRVRCRSCGAALTVADETTAIAADLAAAPAAGPFDRDKFLLRQKHLAISEKYYVWDEAGNTLLFIQRPAHVIRQVLAMLVGIFLMLATIAGGIAAIGFIHDEWGGLLATVIGIVVLPAGIVLSIAAALAISAKRHVHFYPDDSKGRQLLHVFQDKKFQPIVATYTVADGDGIVLARLAKNYLFNLFRKRWYCYNPSGQLVCVAKEDSIILSLLRRFLGTFFGLLRAHFLIFAGDGSDHRVIGEFSRRFTLLDRYVLDMSADRQRGLDRRVAIALGVMLDTGERR